jgi:hypothetical protein
MIIINIIIIIDLYYSINIQFSLDTIVIDASEGVESEIVVEEEEWSDCEGKNSI